MKLNFVQCGELLNMSSVGVKKRIEKYQSELKEYIVRDDKGNIKGFDEKGIEELRNIGVIRRNIKNDALKQEVEIMKVRIEGLNNEIESNRRYIDHLEQEIERVRDENIKLTEELKEFNQMSFWKRLTYRK